MTASPYATNCAGRRARGKPGRNKSRACREGGIFLRLVQQVDERPEQIGFRHHPDYAVIIQNR